MTKQERILISYGLYSIEELVLNLSRDFRENVDIYLSEADYYSLRIQLDNRIPLILLSTKNSDISDYAMAIKYPGIYGYVNVFSSKILKKGFWSYV